MHLPAEGRLKKQLDFLIEIDRLKHILRRTYLMSGDRKENDAEHSWHLCVFAIILHEHVPFQVDLLKALKMILIHDLVEIDAGDTYCYDTAGNLGKRAREEKAADRIFSLLPEDQASWVRSLWEEFEDQATAEARFAAALDRLQPLLHNFCTDGAAWREHGIDRSQVIERNQHIGKASPELWEFALKMIDQAAANGWLKE